MRANTSYVTTIKAAFGFLSVLLTTNMPITISFHKNNICSTAGWRGTEMLLIDTWFIGIKEDKEINQYPAIKCLSTVLIMRANFVTISPVGSSVGITMTGSGKQVERSSDYRCVLERAISRNSTCTSLETTLARPATLCCILYDISCFSMYL